MGIKTTIHEDEYAALQCESEKYYELSDCPTYIKYEQFFKEHYPALPHAVMQYKIAVAILKAVLDAVPTHYGDSE